MRETKPMRRRRNVFAHQIERESRKREHPKKSELKSCGRATPPSEVPKIQVESHDAAIKKGISAATRTQRSDGRHQATVCVICDRCIIGTEKIHKMTKERIQLNQHRLSIKTY